MWERESERERERERVCVCVRECVIMYVWVRVRVCVCVCVCWFHYITIYNIQILLYRLTAHIHIFFSVGIHRFAHKCISSFAFNPFWSIYSHHPHPLCIHLPSKTFSNIPSASHPHTKTIFSFSWRFPCARVRLTAHVQSWLHGYIFSPCTSTTPGVRMPVSLQANSLNHQHHHHQWHLCFGAFTVCLLFSTTCNSWASVSFT